MTTTTVVINDFEFDTRTMSVLENADFEHVASVYDDEDTLLIDLQDNPFFEGRRRWSDLDPTHLRLMIIRNLTIVSELSSEERRNVTCPAVRSLHVLLTMLVYCLQRRSESLIELLRINRISTTEIIYDYAASLNMAVLPMQPVGGLRVVVDNE